VGGGFSLPSVYGAGLYSVYFFTGKGPGHPIGGLLRDESDEEGKMTSNKRIDGATLALWSKHHGDLGKQGVGQYMG